jgi:hypothetical protein
MGIFETKFFWEHLGKMWLGTSWENVVENILGKFFNFGNILAYTHKTSLIRILNFQQTKDEQLHAQLKLKILKRREKKVKEERKKAAKEKLERESKKLETPTAKILRLEMDANSKKAKEARDKREQAAIERQSIKPLLPTGKDLFSLPRGTRKELLQILAKRRVGIFKIYWDFQNVISKVVLFMFVVSYFFIRSKRRVLYESKNFLILEHFGLHTQDILNTNSQSSADQG